MDKHVSTDMTDTRRAAAVDSRISYGYRSILFLFTTTTPWRTYVPPPLVCLLVE